MPTDDRTEYFYSLMRRDLDASQAAYTQRGRLFSAADCAENGEFYRLRRLLWQKLIDGVPVEQALTDMDREWRAYAAKNNAEVQAAGRLRLGPMAGASTIHYRYVSPEKVSSASPHIREMARMADRRASALERSTATV